MRIRELKLFILLLGFLSGNLFGTILGYLRKFLVWDGLIIATLILIFEFISYMSYKNCTTFRFVRIGFTNPSEFSLNREKLSIKELKKPLKHTIKNFYRTKNRLKVWPSFFNFFKIGVMIGFFVDAFKVGS